MDPTYTTMNTGLYMTSSGLAMDMPLEATITPTLYDPSTMSTPWLDTASGIMVAQQPDGTIIPVAVSSADIVASGGLPVPVANLLSTGIQSLGQQLQRWLAPSTPGAAVAPGAGPLAGISPMMWLAIGVGAYFMLRKR